MKKFAALLDKLALTPSRNRKIDAMAEYFANTPDPTRGYALAALTGELSLKEVRSAKLKETVLRHVDERLFKLSYDYVGDLGETIAMIWPFHKDGDLPELSKMIEQINDTPKKDLPAILSDLLSIAEVHERWALVKLASGGLRIGVSARLAKTALAKMSGQNLQEIEEIWHGVKPPYKDLFSWLDGRADKPDIKHTEIFHPLMLSNPVDEDKDFEKFDPADFTAEWKWDGIRVQLSTNGEEGARLFSRTGDDISAAFPDITGNVNGAAVLDGELLVGAPDDPLPFNDLQQRLNRKTVVKRHLEDYPAYICVYDILFDGESDLRALTFLQRRKHLENWLVQNPQPRLTLSDFIKFKDWEALAAIRIKGADERGHEGVMIKEKTSPYLPGRPKGYWYKWKRDPNNLDAILMYAQRGHGKRSSFYSDYTFGVWKGNEIVPIGKAYFGFTDEELKLLDKWIRKNTIGKFGPVREVKKELVFEVAFDSAHESPRHKSGIALRFPRISRIRWDKPAQEANTLEDAQELIV